MHSLIRRVFSKLPWAVNSSSSRGVHLSVDQHASMVHRLWQRMGAKPAINRLDRPNIELVQNRLQEMIKRPVPRHMQFKYNTDQPSSAAVMLLLLEKDNQVCVLFEERDNKMSSHGGEVSFAGGKQDPQDPSLEYTALRETQEELGIPPSSIRVIGRLPPVPNATRTLQVHTIVGVLEENVTLQLNRREVHRAFALPLTHFYDREQQLPVPFRGSTVNWILAFKSGKPGLKVWGLTSFILYEFLCRINGNSQMSAVSSSSSNSNNNNVKAKL